MEKMDISYLRARSLLKRIFSKRKVADTCGALSADNEMFAVIRTLQQVCGVDPKDLVFFYDLDAMKDSEVSKLIRFQRRLPFRFGDGSGGTIDLLQLGDSSREKLRVGLQEMYVDTPKGRKPLWFWISNRTDCIFESCNIARREDYVEIYRTLMRKYRRKEPKIQTPILPKQLLNRLYKNSIAFLERDREVYKAHDIPFRKGMLLSGLPGTGKTLSCRWIQQMCHRRGWQTRVVTLQDYRHTCMHGDVRALFEGFDSRGIIIFDDMDVMLKSREIGNEEVSHFLANMDGVYQTTGVVYLFTTNVWFQLDPAVCRPGRLDVIVKFELPSESLRRQYFAARLIPDIRDTMSSEDMESLITGTHEYSFAELDYIRRIFAIRKLEGMSTDVESVLREYSADRQDFVARLKIQGFGPSDDAGEADTEEYSEFSINPGEY